jgi:hypothetical protein
MPSAHGGHSSSRDSLVQVHRKSVRNENITPSNTQSDFATKRVPVTEHLSFRKARNARPTPRDILLDMSSSDLTERINASTKRQMTTGLSMSTDEALNDRLTHRQPPLQSHCNLVRPGARASDRYGGRPTYTRNRIEAWGHEKTDDSHIHLPSPRNPASPRPCV